MRLSGVSGLEHRTGILDWNTGMTFYMHFQLCSYTIIPIGIIKKTLK